MKIEFVAPAASPRSGDTVVLPAFETTGLAPAVRDLDGALSAKVADLIAAGRFADICGAEGASNFQDDPGGYPACGVSDRQE